MKMAVIDAEVTPESGCKDDQEGRREWQGLPGTEACWALLERVAASEHMRRATRLQELLFYVGKRSLKEGCDRLHEQEIGAKVFKRPASYDTSVDNIVRSTVSDLRRRIETYFNTEGQNEPLIVEIPRGSYLPVFRYRPVEIATPAKAVPCVAEVHALAVPAIKDSRWTPGVRVAAVFAILVLSAGCLYFWLQYRALYHSVFVEQNKPTVMAFWSEFLNANPATDIVTSDPSIGLAEALSHKTFSLSDYLSHSYVSQLQTADMSPDMHASVNRVLSWNLASPDEFVLANRLLALDPLRKKLHLYNARTYMPDLVRQDNLILIGARKANPWDELYDGQINFITQFESPRIINRSPQANEQTTYYENGPIDYCVIAYMPKQDQTGSVLLIEGTNAEATEAAGDFLLSEDQLANFKKMLHVTSLPYFQVLLRVSSVRGTPLTSTIQAYRTYPGQR